MEKKTTFTPEAAVELGIQLYKQERSGIKFSEGTPSRSAREDLRSGIANIWANGAGKAELEKFEDEVKKIERKAKNDEATLQACYRVTAMIADCLYPRPTLWSR